MGDNLATPQVASSQTQKEVTINAATQKLAGVISDYLSVTLSSNVTLTATQFQSYGGFSTTGNTGSTNLTLPAIRRNAVFITNGGSGAMNVTVGSTNISLASGATGIFRLDGTTNGLVKLF